MKSVWRQLLKKQISPGGIEELDSSQLLSTWGLPKDGHSVQDQACAAFYIHALTECSSGRPFGTKADADALAEPYYSAARVCRDMLTFPPYPSDDEARALETAANYIEKRIRWQHEHLLESPYTVGQRTNRVRGFSNRERGLVRALALEVHKIFGGYLYQTISTVANVALDLKGRQQIDKSDAVDWCRGLNKHRSLKAS
jgi:hypothetical protein